MYYKCEVPQRGEVIREYLIMMSTLESKGIFTHDLAFGKNTSFDAFRMDGMIANGDSYIHIEKDMIESIDSDYTFTSFHKKPESIVLI